MIRLVWLYCPSRHVICEQCVR